MRSLSFLRATAILIVLAVFFTACGQQAAPSAGSGAPAPGASAPAPAPASKAPVKDELVLVTNTFGNEAWVAGLSAATDDWLSAPMYDMLVYLKFGTDELVPGLAESWESTPDKKKWTLHLRKGVQFHDGYGELTSADVKFTIETLGSKESVSVAKGYFSTDLESVETPDPYTVIVNLKRGDWSLMRTWLGGQNAYSRIMSKKYVDKVGLTEAARKPIGSGPYKFVSYSPGESLKMEAVPNHWRVTPEFKYYTVKLASEEPTRVAMLKSGEADIIEVGADSAEELRKGGFDLRPVPGGMYEHIILGGQIKETDPPYDPNIPWFLPKEPERALKVRKAMNFAIDRNAIMDKLFHGQGEPGAVFEFFPGQASYDPAWKPYPYNPAEAKKLLTEAGYPNGFEMTMNLWIAPGRPELPDLGEIVSGMWEQNLGLKIKRATVDLAMLRDIQVARKMGQGALTAALAMYAEPSLAFNTVTRSNSTAGQFMSSYLDQYIDAAYRELDDAKRVVATRALGQHLYDNYINIPIGIRPQVYVVGPAVGEWPLHLGVMFVQNPEYAKKKR